jgi:hypothetical protein
MQSHDDWWKLKWRVNNVPLACIAPHVPSNEKPPSLAPKGRLNEPSCLRFGCRDPLDSSAGLRPPVAVRPVPY